MSHLIDSSSRQVKSATPGGSKFHLGSVLLPEKEDFRFQSAGGSGRVSERHLNSSKRSSSAMSDRDPEMLVSFDEGSADVNVSSSPHAHAFKLGQDVLMRMRVLFSAKPS